ncbi:MAG: hypothetical protein D6689_20135, partial [Deltaproteobacteria bacterium]
VALASPRAARTWPGLLAPGAGSPKLAAWLWALAGSAVAYAAASALLTHYFVTHFAAPDVVAVVLAGVQLALVAACAPLALALARAATRLGRALGPARWFNPWANTGAAIVALASIAGGGLAAAALALPQVRPLIPARLLVAAAVWAAATVAAAAHRAHRGAWLPIRPRRRRAAAGAAAVAAVVAIAGLWRAGADPQAKYLAIASSPPLSALITAVRVANDFDRDGYGSLLGENDCGPFDPDIHPGARDIPDNGIDENCNGADFSLAAAPSYRTGERMPVPEAYRRDWNVLLVTVDTLRFDRTGLGDYAERTGRVLTPNLDALARRGVAFRFCNAPSAGTMASVPAIQTSKFFHSGIALSGERRPKPPKVLDVNVTFAEVMKRAGYRTGAILSHYYFNDWGLDQGFDTYDNEIGKENDPRKITSHLVTDKALAWIARNSDRKWFLWVHYIDPHGYYMPHPEFPFGDTEQDKYDAEVAYTDRHLGRMFDELSRMPVADRTVIIVTSDHGDGFKEHGHINHGFYLYREVLHVPLIVYVPDIEPHVVDGAVSPLDILPTVADLAGIDVSDLSFEGESLVPQLFYGRDARDRVVFAETNAGGVQRAAITAKYKLIAKLQSNLYELYDLETDPWEHRSVWGKDARGSELMKRYLDEWLDRVFFSRDPTTNQAEQKRAWHIVTGKPSPQVRVDPPLVYDGGAVELFGYDLTAPQIAPGKTLAIKPYFRVVRRPSADFRLQGEAWLQQQPGRPVRPVRSGAAVTADGFFPSSHWRPGEIVRDAVKVRIPPHWRGDGFFIGLRLLRPDRTPSPVAGDHRPDDPSVGVLGTVRLVAPAPVRPAAPGSAARPRRPAGR